MYEIVIIRAAHYKKGCEVGDLLDWKDRLWWFDEPDMTLERAYQPLDNPQPFAEGLMTCEAFKFEVDYVLNIGVRFFDKSFMEGYELQEGLSEFLPQFVEIAKRKLKECEFGLCLDFYVLFEVEYDTFHDEDGGVDDVVVMAEWVGELDFEKLPNAIVGAASGEAS